MRKDVLIKVLQSKELEKMLRTHVDRNINGFEMKEFCGDNMFAIRVKEETHLLGRAFSTEVIRKATEEADHEAITKTIMEKAIKWYGIRNQVDVAIEEMSELIKALLKQRRKRYKTDLNEETEAICEEIADVQIMLEQLKIIFNISEGELQKHTNFKIKRLEYRIGTEV